MHKTEKYIAYYAIQMYNHAMKGEHGHMQWFDVLVRYQINVKSTKMQLSHYFFGHFSHVYITNGTFPIKMIMCFLKKIIYP